MLIPVHTRQFERDIKRVRKRGKDLEKFKSIARTLIEGDKLDPLHRDHQLVGNYAGRRECHIEADWLLVYAFGSPLNLGGLITKQISEMLLDEKAWSGRVQGGVDIHLGSIEV